MSYLDEIYNPFPDEDNERCPVSDLHPAKLLSVTRDQGLCPVHVFVGKYVEHLERVWRYEQ